MGATSLLAQNLRPFKQQANLTHFLRIPMAVGSSYSRMEDAHRRLKQDPCFHVIPKAALTHLDNLHYAIGELRLDSPQRIHAACELLRSLEKDRWHRVAKVLEDGAIQATRSISVMPTTQSQPFKVDLVGIGGPLTSRFVPDLSASIRLYTYIQESTGLLQNFCYGLYSIFCFEGFGVSDPANVSAKPPLNIRIASTQESSRSRTRDPRRGPNEYRLMRFDARDIYDRYQNSAWVQDVLLQEIRISEIGRPRNPDKSLLHHTFSDIATAALPGFCETQSSKSAGSG